MVVVFMRVITCCAIAGYTYSTKPFGTVTLSLLVSSAERTGRPAEGGTAGACVAVVLDGRNSAIGANHSFWLVGRFGESTVFGS